MKADIFGLGETWSEEGYPEQVFDNFSSFSDLKPKGLGRGKGLSVYSRLGTSFRKFSSASGKVSAILKRLKKVHIIFLYLSMNFNWEELKSVFNDWICDDKPTVIIGDCNWHSDHIHPMKTFLENRGYLQCMTRSTHEKGYKIDHLYICPLVQNLTYKIVQQSIHYSDHDIIGIKIKGDF